MKYENKTLYMIDKANESYLKNNNKVLIKLLNDYRKKILEENIQKCAYSLLDLYIYYSKIKNEKFKNELLVQKIIKQKHKYLNMYCADNKQYYKKINYKYIIILTVILVRHYMFLKFDDFFEEDFKNVFGSDYINIIAPKYKSSNYKLSDNALDKNKKYDVMIDNLMEKIKNNKKILK